MSTLSVNTITNATSVSGAITETFADGSASAPSIAHNGDLNCGLFFPAADTIAASTNGSERLRIDSSGNLGIGTSSPLSATGYTTITVQNTTNGGIVEAKDASVSLRMQTSGVGAGDIGTYSNHPTRLVVNGNEAMRIDSSGNVGIGTTNPSSPGGTINTIVNSSGITIIKSSTSSTTTGQARFDLSTGTGNSYGIISLNDNTGSPYFQMSFGSAITASYYDSPVHIWRTVAGTERMRIDSSGNLQLATTTNYGRFSLTHDGSNYGMTIYTTTTGSAAQTAVRFLRGSSAVTVGAITNTDTTTSYVTSSDYRLKENIQPITTGLATISQLKPVFYDWSINKSKGEGFIAHELQEVVPECVFGEKDAVNEDGSIKPQGVDYSKLVATLTAAIQELNAKVIALEAQLGAK